MASAILVQWETNVISGLLHLREVGRYQGVGYYTIHIQISNGVPRTGMMETRFVVFGTR